MSLLLSGSIAGQVANWTLEGDALTIGRSSRSAVHLPDPTVSKEHAELIRQGGGWSVRDLGSRNGTRVNGVEVREPTALREGDVIEVGSVQLRLRSARPESPTVFSQSAGLGSSVRLRAPEFLGRSSPPSAESGRLVHLLAEAGRVLVLPRPLRETCDQILEFVERAVPATRLVLLLREKPGDVPVQVAARQSGGSASQPLQLSRAILATVLDECTAVVITDAATDPRFQASESIVALAVRSALAVPLFDNERVLGLLYADHRDPRVTYSQEHLEVMTLLANMAAVKITNARLLETEQARMRMAQELATAARIQRGLLPAEPPALAGWTVDAFLESCYEVGGDLYDFHRRPDGTLVVIAGDVAGKGMGAALLMSSFLASARVLYEGCARPGELADRLGALVGRSADRGRFVTGFIGFLDPASGHLRFVNAGHAPPCVVCEGGVRTLESTGVPFGILPGASYAEGETTLGGGEMLALYSDGFLEAQRGDEFFDDERLHAALSDGLALPRLEDARRLILDRVAEFQAGAPRGDDLTLVLMRRERA